MSDPMFVWDDKLDGKYACRVTRVRPYFGTLTLRLGDEILLEKEVTISYDAPFGPDRGDVNIWMDTCADVVDNMKKGEG